LQSLPEVLDRALIGFAGTAVQQESPLKHEVVRLRGLRFGGRQRLAAEQRHLERGDDMARDVVLDSEDVIERPVVGLGPQAIAVGRLDQLRGDTYLAARLAHTALEHMCYVQLPRGVLHRHFLALELEGGRARRYAQIRELGEAVE
jgi:hypothetical protein